MSVRTSVAFADGGSAEDEFVDADDAALRAVFAAAEDEQSSSAASGEQAAQNTGTQQEETDTEAISAAQETGAAVREPEASSPQASGTGNEVVLSADGAQDETNAQMDEAPTSSLHNNSALVNINTATMEELMLLPGIGEVLARRIVESREALGLFQSTADIMRVSGIKEKKYNEIAALITVGN